MGNFIDDNWCELNCWHRYRGVHIHFHDNFLPVILLFQSERGSTQTELTECCQTSTWSMKSASKDWSWFFQKCFLLVISIIQSVPPATSWFDVHPLHHNFAPTHTSGDRGGGVLIRLTHMDMDWLARLQHFYWKDLCRDQTLRREITPSLFPQWIIDFLPLDTQATFIFLAQPLLLFLGFIHLSFLWRKKEFICQSTTSHEDITPWWLLKNTYVLSPHKTLCLTRKVQEQFYSARPGR